MTSGVYSIGDLVIVHDENSILWKQICVIRKIIPKFSSYQTKLALVVSCDNFKLNKQKAKIADDYIGFGYLTLYRKHETPDLIFKDILCQNTK